MSHLTPERLAELVTLYDDALALHSQIEQFNLAGLTPETIAGLNDIFSAIDAWAAATRPTLEQTNAWQFRTNPQ